MGILLRFYEFYLTFESNRSVILTSNAKAIHSISSISGQISSRSYRLMDDLLIPVNFANSICVNFFFSNFSYFQFHKHSMFILTIFYSPLKIVKICAIILL